MPGHPPPQVPSASSGGEQPHLGSTPRSTTDFTDSVGLGFLMNCSLFI
uniref:Uncharacterized protein n=1 Tax=Arundo donax TaxID=35708 RepID=A0A0A9ABM2_ARUDO